MQIRKTCDFWLTKVCGNIYLLQSCENGRKIAFNNLKDILFPLFGRYKDHLVSAYLFLALCRVENHDYYFMKSYI